MAHLVLPQINHAKQYKLQRLERLNGANGRSGTLHIVKLTGCILLYLNYAQPS